MSFKCFFSPKNNNLLQLCPCGRVGGTYGLGWAEGKYLGYIRTRKLRRGPKVLLLL